MTTTRRPILHANPLPTVSQLEHRLRWQCTYRQTQGATQEAIRDGLIDCLCHNVDRADLDAALDLYAVKHGIPEEATPC
jgi:hypothetical protein